jgi:hypothetical protein
MLFWLCYMFYPGFVVKFQKEKRILVCSVRSVVSLTDYFDLVWCLYNDLWGTLILFDDTYDPHFFTQIIGIWRVWESREIAGKDHSSKVLVVCVEIEETYYAGVVSIHDCPLNNSTNWNRLFPSAAIQNLFLFKNAQSEWDTPLSRR